MNNIAAIAVALLLTAPLCGQGFDATGFFGDAFTPDAAAADAGSLQLSLDEPPPDWVDYSGSGASRARGRFNYTPSGLVVSPDADHGTCEARVDIGVARGTISITVAELDQGGAFALHLRDLRDSSRAWLIELKHIAADEWQLLIRARDGGRYVSVPGTRQSLAGLKIPVTLAVEIHVGTLKGTVGDVTSIAKGVFEGLGVALAITDQRARLRDLKLDVTLDPAWAQDAAVRLQARRNLERLRDYATTGLLAGIAASAHPQIEQALMDYTAAEIKQRQAAEDASSRAETLELIAAAHPASAAAQHEAGVALLIAGQPSLAQARLVAADKLTRTHVTSLALCEAYRRIGDNESAARALGQAVADLPEVLHPDYALLAARLLAGEGDIAAAQSVLDRALKKYPERPEIVAFAQSATVLLEPPTLLSIESAGPLGLKVISDVEAAILQPLLARLSPYLERILLWLPGGAEVIAGTVAIFDSPVDYLDAALLVAGENVDNVAGMYLEHGIGGGPTVMACRAFGEDELIRTLVHELWHLALAASGQAAAVPRWLNEGMAVFLSAGIVEKGVMTYTDLPSEFIAFSDEPLKLFTRQSLQGALAAKPAEFYVPGRVQANYLAGWAVVWFYAHASPDSTLLLALLQGDGDAYRQLGDDIKSVHTEVQQALEKEIK